MVMRSLTKITAGTILAIGGLIVAAPANAGGDAPGYGDGLVRHRVPAAVAVPVPAPVPVPETSSGYYVRLDAAYSQSNLSKYQATDSWANSVRGDSYLDNYPRFGIGVGYQFAPRFRMDMTLDWRNDVKSKGAGTRNYQITNTAGPNPFIEMRDTVSDNFTSTNLTGLLNAYYDVQMTPSLTPYVGVGLGFVRHQVKGRVYNSATTCVDLNDCDPTTVGNQAGSTVNSSNSTTAGGTDYNLAAAVMAGLTYKIWDNTKLDLGYRFLHLQGTNFIGRSTTTVENLKIPDQNIHEMRVGLRYDIN